MIEPIRKTVYVRATATRAFEVFTSGISRWWIPTFSINPSRSPIGNVVIEPRVGGRWFERGIDGSECNWGRVLAWDPPHRLVVDWQINVAGRYDADVHSEVEVLFDAQSADTTRITLEHRNFEQMDERARQKRNRRQQGWGDLLEQYAVAVEDTAHVARPDEPHNSFPQQRTTR